MPFCLLLCRIPVSVSLPTFAGVCYCSPHSTASAAAFALLRAPCGVTRSWFGRAKRACACCILCRSRGQEEGEGRQGLPLRAPAAHRRAARRGGRRRDAAPATRTARDAALPPLPTTRCLLYPSLCCYAAAARRAAACLPPPALLLPVAPSTTCGAFRWALRCMPPARRGRNDQDGRAGVSPCGSSWQRGMTSFILLVRLFLYPIVRVCSGFARNAGGATGAAIPRALKPLITGCSRGAHSATFHLHALLCATPTLCWPFRLNLRSLC